MKFARYLQSHSIDEWRRAYIDYRQLKKQIGRAEDELAGLDENGQLASESNEERTRSRPTPSRKGTTHSAASFGSPTLGQAGEIAGLDHDLELGNEGDSEDADDERVKQVQSPESINRELPHGDDDPREPTRPSPSRQNSGLSTSSREHSGETTRTTRTESRLVPKPSEDGRTKTFFRRTSTSDRFRAGERFKMEEATRRKWRFDLSHQDSLETVFDRIPPQSKRFFKLVDRELDKVNAFWEDRQRQALDRYDELSQQWKELSDHKKEFQASKMHEYHAPKALKAVLPKSAHSVPGSGLIRRTFASRGRSPPNESPNEDRNEREGRERRDNDEAEGRSSAMKRDDSDARQKAALRHGRPEEYTQARSKLKLATFEYYRYLGMLKSYRVLNRTGFAKAVKKFEKATSIPCGIQWKPKIENSTFISSPELEELIRKTEDAFASVFEHGDRKKALERLRDFGEKKHHHFTAWRAGMLMGAGLPLMIEALVKSFHPDTRRDIPAWGALLQLFGACYLPVFFTLAFFINLATWQYGRINYVLIFELDIRNKLDPRQFLEIPAVLFFVLSLFFWLAFSNPWPDHISPYSYPLAWLVFTMVVLLNPLSIFYGSARWWMLRSICRVVSSGIVAVRFRDFFLGDELNSIYYSIYNLGFLYCTYNHGWPANVQDICSTNKTWTTAVLASLPPFFRLGQSIRRYIDSDGLFLHLLNSGKYSATIVYFWFYFNWRIDMTRSGSSDDWRFALFIVFATINSVYVASWDILLDWSLGKRNPKHPWLRPELGYFKDQWWLYYVISVVNVILRFSWVLYLAPHPSASVQSYIIALVEASRRIMWNTFRVEAEHIGNRDGYRVTRDVSLPYMSASSPEQDGPIINEDEEDDTSLPYRKRFFLALHRLHASILKNLEPVIDSFVDATGWWRVGWSKQRGTKENSDDEEDGLDEIDQNDGTKRRSSTRGGGGERGRRKRRRSTIDPGESPSSGGEDASSTTEDKNTIASMLGTSAGDGFGAEKVEGGAEREEVDVGSERLGGNSSSPPRKRDLSSDDEDEEESRRDDFAAGGAGDAQLQKEMDEVERMQDIGKSS